jgi:hypothetical protein
MSIYKKQSSGQAEVQNSASELAVSENSLLQPANHEDVNYQIQRQTLQSESNLSSRLSDSRQSITPIGVT